MTRTCELTVKITELNSDRRNAGLCNTLRKFSSPTKW